MTTVELTSEDFDAFYAAVYGNEPFPWQRRLAEQVCSQGK